MRFGGDTSAEAIDCRRRSGRSTRDVQVGGTRAVDVPRRAEETPRLAATPRRAEAGSSTRWCFDADERDRGLARMPCRRKPGDPSGGTRTSMRHSRTRGARVSDRMAAASSCAESGALARGASIAARARTRRTNSTPQLDARRRGLLGRDRFGTAARSWRAAPSGVGQSELRVRASGVRRRRGTRAFRDPFDGTDSGGTEKDWRREVWVHEGFEPRGIGGHRDGGGRGPSLGV